MDVATTKALLMTIFIVAFTGVAAYIDWRTQKLPNWLTVSCFATALVFHFVAGFFGAGGGVANAFIQLGWAIAGFATGFGILYVLWAIGGGGGGDVKMMGAMGAWLMPSMILYVFIITGVLTVLFYFRLIVNGEMAKLKKAKKVAERTGVKKKFKPHHAHYALRAGLAVWMVLAYFMIQNRPFPTFQSRSANSATEELSGNLGGHLGGKRAT